MTPPHPHPAFSSPLAPAWRPHSPQSDSHEKTLLCLQSRGGNRSAYSKVRGGVLNFQRGVAVSDNVQKTA